MIRPILTSFELALQGTIGHFLARLAQILEINGETLVRNGTRVVGIWLLAWLAYRLVRLAAIRIENCLLYTSPSPRDRQKSRMPSSA